MKKLLKISLLLLFTINCNSQTVIPLEEQNGTVLSGAYYKDKNGSLNYYDGIWQYSNGLDTLKIVLRKKIFQPVGNYHEDLLIGEIKYVKNGVLKASTLSAISIDYSNNNRHTISGNIVLTSPDFLNCTDCISGEKRIYLGFVDPSTNINRAGYMVLKKQIISGLDVIKIFVGYEGQAIKDGETLQTPTIKYGRYTLIKQ